MSELLGPVLVLVFTLSQAFRDVYFSSAFQKFDFFAVILLAFTLSTMIFAVVALVRSPGDFRKLRGQGGTMLAAQITTALAWSSFFFALTQIDPSVVNTIHSAMGPLVVVVLGAFGISLAQRTAPTPLERVGYVGMALSVVCLWVVVLGGYSGLAVKSTGATAAGLGLLAVSGTAITLSLLYCKRLQDNGVGAEALTTVRYGGLILFAAAVVFLRDRPTGIETLREACTLAAAALLLIVFPLYALQVGIGRLTPLTANVVRALGPVFVFVLEQFDGRIQYSLPVLVCILIYSASVILCNLARGWRDTPQPAISVSR